MCANATAGRILISSQIHQGWMCPSQLLDLMTPAVVVSMCYVRVFRYSALEIGL